MGMEVKKEVHPSVCRAAVKLQDLQKRCHMDIILVGHVAASFPHVGGAELQQDVLMTREEVTRTLTEMFHGALQEVPVTAAEETCSLMFQMFQRSVFRRRRPCSDSPSGRVSARSLQTVLIALSADDLLLKFRSLVRLSGDASGRISSSGLQTLLRDLSQVPAAVQEGGVFGGVDAAVSSCFSQVSTQTASQEHVLSWLQSDPQLLLWLPALHRLSVSQYVSHAVRCHTCKTTPITGLRYRCMKCVNVHVCQSCFLTNRQSRKHKSHHPVLEFWTQPTWRESLASFVRSARHTLLPRRYSHRDNDRRGIVMWAEQVETQTSAPPSSDTSTLLAVSAPSPSSDLDSTHDASVQPPPPCSSKALQTEEEPANEQASALRTEVQNLQRDKWLMEQQLRAWRHAVQSDHGLLDDRCSQVEVTVETLRRDNVRLQDMLTQALKDMEARQHAKQETTDEEFLMDTTDHHGDTEEYGQEEEEEETSTPTILRGSTLSQNSQEESSDDTCYSCPIGEQNEPQEEGPYEDVHLSEDEQEEELDCGICSPEKLLQETVATLKTVMEMDRWTDRTTGEGQGAELLEAAEQVGCCVRHLLDAVRK